MLTYTVANSKIFLWVSLQPLALNTYRNELAPRIWGSCCKITPHLHKKKSLGYVALKDVVYINVNCKGAKSHFPHHTSQNKYLRGFDILPWTRDKGQHYSVPLAASPLHLNQRTRVVAAPNVKPPIVKGPCPRKLSSPCPTPSSALGKELRPAPASIGSQTPTDF